MPSVLFNKCKYCYGYYTSYTCSSCWDGYTVDVSLYRFDFTTFKSMQGSYGSMAISDTGDLACILIIIYYPHRLLKFINNRC